MIAAASWAGTLPGWLTVLAVVVAIATYVRGNRSTAIRNLRDERDELDRECKRLKERERQLLAANVKLEATRDLTPIISAMLESSQKHEERAQGRFDKTCTILDLIAKRLGPNGNGS